MREYGVRGTSTVHAYGVSGRYLTQLSSSFIGESRNVKRDRLCPRAPILHCLLARLSPLALPTRNFALSTFSTSVTTHFDTISTSPHHVTLITHRSLYRRCPRLHGNGPDGTNKSAIGGHMVDQITPGLHRTRTYHSSPPPSLSPEKAD